MNITQSARHMHRDVTQSARAQLYMNITQSARVQLFMCATITQSIEYVMGMITNSEINIKSTHQN